MSRRVNVLAAAGWKPPVGGLWATVSCVSSTAASRTAYFQCCAAPRLPLAGCLCHSRRGSLCPLQASLLYHNAHDSRLPPPCHPHNSCRLTDTLIPHALCGDRRRRLSAVLRTGGETGVTGSTDNTFACILPGSAELASVPTGRRLVSHSSRTHEQPRRAACACSLLATPRVPAQRRASSAAPASAAAAAAASAASLLRASINSSSAVFEPSTACAGGGGGAPGAAGRPTRSAKYCAANACRSAGCAARSASGRSSKGRRPAEAAHGGSAPAPAGPPSQSPSAAPAGRQGRQSRRRALPCLLQRPPHDLIAAQAIQRAHQA